MVDIAVDRARSCGFGEIEGQVCDVQALPFQSESFDVVMANNVMYHVASPDNGVAELARVVKRSGTVLVGTNGTGHMRELNEVIDEVFGSRIDDPNATFGIDSGDARLRHYFASVVWHAYDSDLVVDAPKRLLPTASRIRRVTLLLRRSSTNFATPCSVASAPDPCESKLDRACSSAPTPPADNGADHEGMGVRSATYPVEDAGSRRNGRSPKVRRRKGR